MDNNRLMELNRLDEKYRNDPDYNRFQGLVREAAQECKAAPAQKQIRVTDDGDIYYLVFPYKVMNHDRTGWFYVEHGFDLNVKRADGRSEHFCQSLQGLSKEEVYALMERDIRFKKQFPGGGYRVSMIAPVKKKKRAGR